MVTTTISKAPPTVGVSRMASSPPEKPQKPSPKAMPMKEDNFSVVKYLYTMDSIITAKKATVPDIMPLIIQQERLSPSRTCYSVTNV
jgi:hypothetical protein